ncbi:AraC family transcriptional regulator [Lysinibacillus fusiformis]|uniref:AraC family transcriptional regulator n=1 Tax=Lysinibacillus fusiformis TaxID=28031 RepID=UPI0000F38CFB|nr:AraC family transcriptional regulator [Lysinibacillus fusiformis]EAZ87837.1 FhuD [Bacillus sp. B14905]MED4075424.1 AraC family transcriptional regulator [Lysinibacillus fusiformis]
MSNDMDSTNNFTKEMIDKAVRLWTRSSISLIDVRYKLIHPDKPIQSYRMPTSMLVYTCGGTANVKLDQTLYQSERFGIFHGGKGTEISIHPVSSSVETYMVLYRAETPPFYKREIYRLLEQINPFIQTYGFSPGNPTFFMEKFLNMKNHWNRESVLNQFYSKIILYQIVYEIYNELEKGDILYCQPDYVVIVKQYLEQHYSESVSIQQLIEMLPISRSQLIRLFKKREHKSPQELLNEKRLDSAKWHLQYTNATIQEIAVGCGFVDGLNLIRMFKKYNHMTPSEYRIKMITDKDINDIDNDYQPQYNERELYKLVKSKGNEELLMLGKTRNKEIIFAAALSLMLLLSGCTSNAPVNKGATGSQSETQTQTTSNAEAKGMPQTRIVNTLKGDVEVPVNPQRVVVLYLMGDLLALGIKPVGISTLVGEGDAAIASELDGITTLGDGQPSPEAVLALNPDLIIVTTDEIYDKLHKIAPTLYIPYDLPVEERMDILGKAFGKEDQAKELLDNFYNKVELSKQKLQQAGILNKTVTVMESNKGSMAVMVGMGYGRGSQIIYQYLGMKAPEIVQQKIETSKNDATSMDVSYEVLNQYAGDYVFRSAFEGMEDLSDNQIWNNIPAVKDGRLIDMSFGLFFYNDIFSLDKQLDFVVDSLLSSVESEELR